MDAVNTVTHAIISNQIALNHNESLKHTAFYIREFKQAVNKLLPLLIKSETNYDEFFNKNEDSTSEVYDVYNEFIETVASVPIWEAANITAIIKAYKKDPNSIQGIVNKINR